MTLNAVMALISCYFTKFGSFRGALRRNVRVRCHEKFTFAISSADEFLVIFVHSCFFFCENVYFLSISEECLIENDIRSYSYLTNGYVPIVSGDDDVELYRQVLEAMDVLSFTKDEQICQLPILCLSS